VEITQGIQCLDPSQGDTGCKDNSISLVRGKATVIRVFPWVIWPAGNHTNAAVDAVLLLTDPTADNLTSLNGPIVLKEWPDRAAINDSLNFRLPQEWTEYGEIWVDVIINPDHAVLEADYSNNLRSLKLGFNQRDDLTVLYLPIDYQPAGSNPASPSDRIRSASYLIRLWYPLRQGGLHYLGAPSVPYTASLTAQGGKSDFKVFLNRYYWTLWLLGTENPPDQLMAWLPTVQGFPLGSSDPLWRKPSGKGRVTFSQDTLDGGHTMAHELAHNLGCVIP